MATLHPDEKAYEDTLNDDVKDEHLGQPASEAEITRVLRKMDWHILPFVSLLYLLSFLWVPVTFYIRQNIDV
jgi:hypothetical protein